MNFNDQVQSYIRSKQMKWASTTLKSESSRLHAHEALVSLSPEQAFKNLEVKLKPYSVKTTMIRIAEFKNFMGDSSWKLFLTENSKLFQNAYTKERLDVTYDQALQRIGSITSSSIRVFCKELLFSGARISELLSHRNGSVKGKGGRIRELFLQFPSTEYRHLTYSEAYQAIKGLGLKPHGLRKLAATRMVALGFNEAELMRVMGWNSMATASSYLQPKQDAEIMKRLSAHYAEINNGN